MEHAQRMGEYLRYRSAIGVRLSELAILVTARQWDQQVEWAIHAPIAAQAGILPAVIDAIGRRQRPPGMQAYTVAVMRIASATRGDDGALWVNLRGHPARLPVSQRFQHLFKGM